MLVQPGSGHSREITVDTFISCVSSEVHASPERQPSLPSGLEGRMLTKTPVCSSRHHKQVDTPLQRYMALSDTDQRTWMPRSAKRQRQGQHQAPSSACGSTASADGSLLMDQPIRQGKILCSKHAALGLGHSWPAETSNPASQGKGLGQQLLRREHSAHQAPLQRILG